MMEISPDNRWLVTGGGASNTAYLWNLTAKYPAARPVFLRGHENYVKAMRISPDSHWLVTGGKDGSVRVWDLTAKDPAASPVVLRGREQEVDTIAISSDSRWLVTGTIDGLAYLWPLQVKDLVDLAHTTAGRNFTAEEWELYFPDERYRKTFADSPGP